MPFAVVFILLICAVFFFSVNTQQVAIEKTRVDNAADAAAYSAGVVQARALNFAAYTNRAIVANQVAIAQTLSIVNWINFAGSFYSSTEIDNIGVLLEAGTSIDIHGGGPQLPGGPSCAIKIEHEYDNCLLGGQTLAEAADAAHKFARFGVLTVASLIVQYYGYTPDDYTSTVLPIVNAVGSVFITWMDSSLFFLEAAQRSVFKEVAGVPAHMVRAQEAAKEVVDAMEDDGLHATVLVNPVVSGAKGVSNIVKRYEKHDDGTDERGRQQAVVLASLDDIVKDRSWHVYSDLSLPANPRKPWKRGLVAAAEFHRVGETKMPDLDHWTALDSISFKRNIIRRGKIKDTGKEFAHADSQIGGDRHLNWKFFGDTDGDTSVSAETQSGGGTDADGCGGSSGASSNDSGKWIEKATKQLTQIGLPGISGNAEMKIMCHAENPYVKMPGFFGVYAGMSPMYDIKDPKNHEPKAHRAGVAVLVHKDKKDTLTAGHHPSLSPGGQLALFSDAPTVSKLSSLARAEVLFRRPPRADKKIEHPNLYNPYWTTRLVPPTEEDRVAALAAVGAASVLRR